jgi:hypothetical protein
MRTVIDLSPAAIMDLAVWRETLDRNTFVQRRLATAYTDALFQLLTDTGGLPATGRMDRTGTPHRYWHELTSGVWAEYTIVDVGIPLVNRRREIVIARLVPLPSHQSVPTVPLPGSP